MNVVAQRVLTDLGKHLDGPTVWEISNRAEKAGMTVAEYLLALGTGRTPRKPKARKQREAAPLRRSPAQAEEARLIRVGVSNTAARVLAVEVSRRKA